MRSLPQRYFWGLGKAAPSQGLLCTPCPKPRPSLGVKAQGLTVINSYEGL